MKEQYKLSNDKCNWSVRLCSGPCYLVLLPPRLFSATGLNLCTINQIMLWLGQQGKLYQCWAKLAPLLITFFPQSNKDRILINKLENATYQVQS